MTILDRIRPGVRAMSGYVPGKQPKPGQRLIKLNTNENPFPPPQQVLAALSAALNGDRLRRYPDPGSRPVREAAARAYGLAPEHVVAGNGSDDLLTMILRTCVDPGQVVTAPEPTYSLYETLTELQGGRFQPVPWPADFTLPIPALLATGARVIFIVRPNAPTGHMVDLAAIADLCQRSPGIVVLDEAYVDFADDNGLPLLTDHPNLIITRTFSKSLALAGLRIGLGFMHPTLAEQMHKVRDSYNVNHLSQAAAVAALDNLSAYEPIIDTIRAERRRLSDALERRGFRVQPSQANFILTTVPDGPRSGQEWFEGLLKKNILVRYFGKDPRLADKLRITIGSREEMDELLAAVDDLSTVTGSER